MIKKNLIFSLVFLFLVLLSSSHLWHKDVWFHTDVARDFLVIRDMVEIRRPTLLGPRSGSIQGIFHGPLWFYVNLPAFVLVQGDPVGMGLYWWCLGFFFLGGFFLLTKNVTGNVATSILTTILLSGFILTKITNLFNPYGAVFLSPFFFWTLFKFTQKPTFQSASLMWCLLGCMIQFQMAFAGPILLLVIPLFIWKVVTTRKVTLVFSSCFLILTLSTFLLFDIRHDFLQTRSVFAYLTDHSQRSATFSQVFLHHSKSMLFDGWRITLEWKMLAPIIVLLWLWRGLSTTDQKSRQLTLLFLYLYTGYWLLTLGFSGEIWEYYYLPFVPITILWMTYIARNKLVLNILLGTFALLNSLWMIPRLYYQPQDFDASSWRLVSQIAQDTFQSNQEFGYFLYNQDQLAYSLKYAFLFNQNPYSAQATPFAKRPVTILVKSQDDPRNPYSTSAGWQKEKVRISKEPDNIQTYPFGFSVERYNLSKDEAEISPDENLIKGLEFR